MGGNPTLAAIILRPRETSFAYFHLVLLQVANAEECPDDNSDEENGKKGIPKRLRGLAKLPPERNCQ